MTCRCRKKPKVERVHEPDPMLDHYDEYEWTGFEGYDWTNEWLRQQRGPFLMTQAATEWTKPAPSEMDEAFKAAKVGRKQPDSLALHVTAIDTLPKLLYRQLNHAVDIAGEDVEYDVIKLWRNGTLVSLLTYTNFMDDPHPALEQVTTVDLESQELRQQDLSQQQSPPILHRKEELLESDHPRASEFRKLTKQEEQRGLLNQPDIDTRGGWEDLLAAKELTIDDYKLRKAEAMRIANPWWWQSNETASTDYDKPFWVDPDTQIPVHDILDEFDDLLAIQCSDGNWNFDPYLHGMANGMILMRAIVSGEEPNYLEAPDSWLNEDAEEYTAGVEVGTRLGCTVGGISRREASRYQLEPIEREIEGLEQDIRHYQDLWEAGRINESVYRDRIEDLQEDLDAAEQELRQLQRHWRKI